MLVEPTNLGKLTPIHTDFGSNSGDLLVVEYDVPQTKIKQTLFYKYGQLSIPKWALIPAGIVTFGLLTALFAIILNSILSQKLATVTYSQACSKISKCKTDVGLICGSQSRCVCPNKQYWYENRCVNQPTYTEQCNQTTECRTDLDLVCAEMEGQCNCPNTTIVQTCDCSSTSYWTGSTCTTRLSYLDACSVAGTSYQCISNLYCNGSKCICSPNTQYWNSTASECYSVDEYRALCNLSTSYSCDATVSLVCLSAGLGSQCPFNVTANTTSCDCANETYWNGGSCVSKKTIYTPCFWNCECDSALGLQCLNMSCVCPKKYYWSTVSSSCQAQMNYSQTLCYNTSNCDTSQGLICHLSGSQCNCPQTSLLNMCDCLKTQYYDYNLTSCQTLHSYNNTCLDDYMCDSTLGLFCQLNISSTANCSCPEPIRSNMCDCNMTSYWNGITCIPRLAPNISCSFPYQCQTGLTCIVNETSIGIFSDVCRCPLGSYYVTGLGCAPSMNYTQSCDGSYQCYELAPLSCRYVDTGLTCLDTNSYSLPACDCSDNYYFDSTLKVCTSLLSRFNSCNTTCQCTPPYQCSISGKCDCAVFYSSVYQTCVDYLSFGDQCINTSQCNATPNALMSCINGTCGCSSSGFWDGSKCKFTSNFRSICTKDSNCFGDLKCENIACIDSNKRCSCPDNTYYSLSNHSCISCTGSDSNSYKKYVINYPTSDLCVGVRSPSGSFFSSISFSTADSQCRSLSTMATAGTPQLLSVHNQTELNCIAGALQPDNEDRTCSNTRYFYLGLIPPNATFYDGTSYSSAFSSPPMDSTQCLTYCYNNGQTGYLYFKPCSDFSVTNRYGAICDYQVY